MQQIANLQALRALAAAMVVAYHLRDAPGVALFGVSQLRVGAAGVDLFFVLSGVVVTMSALRPGTRALAFLARRVVRVVPLYWVATIGLTAAVLAGASPLGLTAADVTPGSILRSLAFFPYARMDGTLMPVLGVGWTLNFEMLFYVAVALAIASGRHWPGLLALGLGALVLAGAVWPGRGAGLRVATHPLLLEFLAGMALALWWRAAGQRPRPFPGLRPRPGPLADQSGRSHSTEPPGDGRRLHRRADLILGLALSGVGALWLVLVARYPLGTPLEPARVIVFGPPAVLLVAGAMLSERGGRRVTSALVLRLGAASYAVYLVHLPVIQIVVTLASAAGWPVERPGATGVLCLAAFVLSHVAGLAVHDRVERPLTAWLTGRGGGPARDASHIVPGAIFRADRAGPASARADVGTEGPRSRPKAARMAATNGPAGGRFATVPSGDGCVPDTTLGRPMAPPAVAVPSAVPVSDRPMAGPPNPGEIAPGNAADARSVRS